MHRHPSRALLAVGLSAALVAGCSSASDDDASRQSSSTTAAGKVAPSGSTEPKEPDSGDAVYPGEAWEAEPAASLGFDEAKLETIAADAKAGGSDCLMVIRHGKVAGEWYWAGTDEDSTREVFSVTKSITATLVGIAQDEGDLAVTDPASKYLPEWKGTDSAEVTVQNLVSNDSGRQWSLALDYSDMIQAPDRSQFAIDLGQDAPPGQSWAYNNSAIQTLSEVLQAATGTEPSAYAEDHLFEPIGMSNSKMTTDNAGNTLTFMGLQSNCSDLARFGLLALHEGAWDGEQVVSKKWMHAATRKSSQDLNEGYGYLWWLNRKGRIASASQATEVGGDGGTSQGQMVEGAPEEMFWALGLGDQVVQVDPGTDTVVVRVGAIAPPKGAEAFDSSAASRVVTEAIADSGR